jgi:hypothetical protein
LVGQPLDDHQVDIAEINREAFDACKRLVEDVAAGHYSAALTVFGDTGTGKTHLIGRVRRWLEPQAGKLFVFVRMETSPAGIWRHVRRSLALALLRANADGVREIDRLLGPRQSVLEILEHRDLSIALEHLLAGRHVRDSAAWLRGEGLPDEVLQSLRLAAPGPDDDPETTSRHIVNAICELIRPGVVVFCMDQVEAVQSSPGDREGPHAFGRVVSCLIDETRNAGVICCEQSSFVNLMEQILDGAAKSRMLGRRAAILPLSWEQAQRLIGARLDTVPELAAKRAEHGGCWPLKESAIRSVFVDNAAPARKIIARCKDLFDGRESDGPSGPDLQQPDLQKMFEERFAPKDPSLTEDILRNGMPLLARSAGLQCSIPGNRSPLDFAVDGERVAIAIINDANNRSLANRLKKISGVWSPAANQRLLLLRDARMRPIPPSAKACHKHLDAIQQRGGRMVTVSPEAVAALAALRRLLSDADSGDLAHNGEPVSAGVVAQWIFDHRPAALDPLVAAMEGPPDVLTPRLAALLAEMKMVSLEDAARRLEVETGKIEECARRDPRQFGILGGRVPALFQPVTMSESQ